VPHAHARPHGEVDEVAHAPPVADLAFAQRGQVDVVLEADLGAQHLADRLGQPVPAPSRQAGGQGHQVPPGIEHAGASHRGVGDLAPREAGLAGQVMRDLTDLTDQGAGAPDTGPFVAAGDDRPGDVGDGGPDPVPADVDADHAAGRGVDLVEHCAGPPPAPGPAHLPDQARLDQLAQRHRHRRFGQAALPGQLGAGEGTALMDQLQDRTLVHGPQQGRGPGGERSLHVRLPLGSRRPRYVGPGGPPLTGRL